MLLFLLLLLIPCLMAFPYLALGYLRKKNAWLKKHTLSLTASYLLLILAAAKLVTKHYYALAITIVVGSIIASILWREDRARSE